MIVGAHAIVYSEHAEKDRAFFRDVLKLPFVDSGDGWLIFALPPSELAVHPATRSGRQELYLLTDDVGRFAAAMAKKKVPCGPIVDARWGRLAELTLPGGGKVGVYEPRHARPKAPAKKKARKRAP